MRPLLDTKIHQLNRLLQKTTDFTAHQLAITHENPFLTVQTPSIANRRSLADADQRPAHSSTKARCCSPSKQHERFDAVKTNERNTRTTRNWQKYCTQATGECQSLVDGRKLTWLLGWEDFTEEANGLWTTRFHHNIQEKPEEQLLITLANRTTRRLR